MPLPFARIGFTRATCWCFATCESYAAPDDCSGLEPRGRLQYDANTEPRVEDERGISFQPAAHDESAVTPR